MARKAREGSPANGEPRPRRVVRDPVTELAKSAAAGHKVAQQLLRQAANDPDPKTRKKAKQALKEIRKRNDQAARAEVHRRFREGT